MKNFYLKDRNMNQQLSKIDQVLAANPEMRREAKIEILQSTTTNKTAYIDQAGRVQWGEEVTLTPKGLKPFNEFSNPPDAAVSQVTPHPHAENMRLFAEDAAETDKPWQRWEFKTPAAKGWGNLHQSPMWDRDTEYRRKQITKPIDLSILIESGIDCEFWTHTLANGEPDVRYVSPLKMFYKNDAGNCVAYHKAGTTPFCRPRMNHWHSWAGGECPVPEGLIGEMMFRSGRKSTITLKLDTLNWFYSDIIPESDIIAFKVTNLADGYCWPWDITPA